MSCFIGLIRKKNFQLIFFIRWSLITKHSFSVFQNGNFWCFLFHFSFYDVIWYESKFVKKCSILFTLLTLFKVMMTFFSSFYPTNSRAIVNHCIEVIQHTSKAQPSACGPFSHEKSGIDLWSYFLIRAVLNCPLTDATLFYALLKFIF